ncbi:hypothetical protein E2542_SST22225 [Spatholobus suberectus]|nr:hypothetical protein E2542_SST22225 [Spatholobus suberectus]
MLKHLPLLKSHESSGVEVQNPHAQVCLSQESWKDVYMVDAMVLKIWMGGEVLPILLQIGLEEAKLTEAVMSWGWARSG